MDRSGSPAAGCRFEPPKCLRRTRGFVWSASVARGLLVGFDLCASVLGAMRWKLKGLIPVVQAAGPDVARSVIAHCVGGRRTPFVEVLQDAERVVDRRESKVHPDNHIVRLVDGV